MCLLDKRSSLDINFIRGDWDAKESNLWNKWLIKRIVFMTEQKTNETKMIDGIK